MIHKLDNGSASCYVITSLMPHKKQEIFGSVEGLLEYFQDDWIENECKDVMIESVGSDEWIDVQFDHLKISHTAEEWEAIYGHKTMILS